MSAYISLKFFDKNDFLKYSSFGGKLNRDKN